MKKALSILIVVSILLCVTVLDVSAVSESVTVEEKLYAAIFNMQDSVSVREYKIPLSEMDMLVSSMQHLYPELFHLDRQYAYFEYYYSGQQCIDKLFFYYTMTKEEYKNCLNEFNLWIKEIASGVDRNASDIEKLFYVHEYFVSNLTYDLSYQIYDAYQILKYKRGVCQAYTLAFTAVMREMGIFSTSALNNPENHCWNIVKLGDNYYHIDTTHDGPITPYDVENDNILYAGNNASRSFFLLSDETVERLSAHTSWVVVGGHVVCEDASYESIFWEQYKQPNIYCDGVWYQVDKTGSFVNKNGEYYYPGNITKILEDGSLEVVKTINTPARLIDNKYYGVQHNGYAVGNVIYGCSGNDFWCYNPKTDEFEIYYTSEKKVVDSYYAGGGMIVFAVENENGIYEYYYNQLAMGDIDGDGEILVNDLVGLKKYLLLRKSDFNYGLLDLNADGYTNILDYITMQKVMA